MTEGGASKKKRNQAFRRIQTPKKEKEQNKEKPKNKKYRNPNPRKALNLFFPTYFFAKT